jgi:serine/threonine-protein kinase HipA
MNRQATILMKNSEAGVLQETELGYVFQYNRAYLQREDAQAISCTLPLSAEPYLSKTLHAFFDGLIPEGWLLDIAEQTWKINPRDRMGLLLQCCHDCIGAVHVKINKNTSDAILQ